MLLPPLLLFTLDGNRDGDTRAVFFFVKELVELRYPGVGVLLRSLLLLLSWYVFRLGLIVLLETVRTTRPVDRDRLIFNGLPYSEYEGKGEAPLYVCFATCLPTFGAMENRITECLEASGSECGGASLKKLPFLF